MICSDFLLHMWNSRSLLKWKSKWKWVCSECYCLFQLPSELRASVNCTSTAPLGHLWRVSRVNTGTIAVYSQDKQHNPQVLCTSMGLQRKKTHPKKSSFKYRNIFPKGPVGKLCESCHYRIILERKGYKEAASVWVGTQQIFSNNNLRFQRRRHLCFSLNIWFIKWRRVYRVKYWSLLWTFFSK